MKLHVALAALAPAVVGGCTDSATAAKTERAPNVVLICLDTVRADHLGAYGYRANPTTPALDALAESSTVFADASATAGWTKPSVPSFLTGTYPSQHGVYEGSARGEEGKVTDLLPQEATTIAEVLHSNGYATAAFVKNAQLRRGNGFEQGFELYEDDAGDARGIRWRAEDWLEERGDARPFFLYLHFLDAHWPYPVPEEYASRFTSLESVAAFRGGDSRALRDDVNDGKRKLSEAELAALVDLYDGSLRYIDDELGRFFAFLERRGLFEDSIVCVVADHGEEFLEHGRIGHGHGLHENLLRVPFVLRVPGRAPRSVETPVSLVDLFPTLLAAAAARGVPECEGVDRLAREGEARPILAEHKEPGAYQHSLRTGARKFVRRFEPESRAESSVARAELPAIGTRWEAELDPDSVAEALAKRLSPREESANEPLELKGVLERAGGDLVRVSGIDARLSAATELYGALPADVASAADLPASIGVKLVGSVESGVLVARRVKVYPLGEPIDGELRGTVTSVEGTPESGRVAIGGLWVAVSSRTHFEGAARESRPPFSREQVAEILADASSAGARGAFRASSRCFDLGADPHELSPAGGDACGELGRGLDALARALVSRRIWHASDRTTLGRDALRGLEELGYVK